MNIDVLKGIGPKTSKIFNNNGIIGLFNGIYKYAGQGISVAIIFAFLITIFFKVKN